MYNKLFSKIVDSSIWMEPDHVRLIWMMFIAIMDEDGFVNLASIKNVAHRAVVDVERAADAIHVLESPDPESSNPANEGRRLTRVPGGWIVNNSKEYRDIVKREHQKELNRERVRRHRKCNAAVMTCNENVTPSDTEAEAEAEAEKTEVIVSDDPPAPYQIIAEQFVAAFGGTIRLTDKRKQAIKTRWRDPWWRDNWQAALERGCQSAFLTGQNDRGWKINFDFFLKPDSVTNIIEGKYDGQQRVQLTANQQREQNTADVFDEIRRQAIAAGIDPDRDHRLNFSGAPQTAGFIETHS